MDDLLCRDSLGSVSALFEGDHVDKILKALGW